MTDLPKLVRAAPKLLYGLAIFWVAFQIALPMAELNEIGYSIEYGTEGAFTRYAFIGLVERALYDGLFILGLGLNAHILLAIWANTRESHAALEAAE